MIVLVAIGLAMASVLAWLGIGCMMRRTDSTSGTLVTSLPAAGAGDIRQLSPAILASDFEPEDHVPAAHAQMLLAWLQGENGRTGQWLADELLEAYFEACLWHGWLEKNWVAVGRHFAGLSGGKKYARVDGKRVRVYDVPEMTTPAAATNVHALPKPKRRRAAQTLDEAA